MKTLLAILLVTILSTSPVQAGTGKVMWGWGFYCTIDSNGTFVCTCVRTNPAGRVPGKKGGKK